MNYKSKIFVCSVILLTLILGCILSTKPAISEKPSNQIIVENSTVEVITENKKAQGIDSSSSMSNLPLDEVRTKTICVNETITDEVILTNLIIGQTYQIDVEIYEQFEPIQYEDTSVYPKKKLKIENDMIASFVFVATNVTETKTITFSFDKSVMEDENNLLEISEIYYPTCSYKPPVLPSIIPTITPNPEPTKAPTQVPKPTVTPMPKKNNGTVAYPTGAAGIQYTDNKNGHTFKPYTHYTAYTAKNSQQYKLQQIARTADNSIRVVTDPNGVDRYCVALGTHWAGGMPVDIGRCVDVQMTNGAVLHCVLGDVKRIEDTKNKGGYYGETNNDVLEFIVGSPILPAIKTSGNCSNAGEEFKGGITSITVLNLYIEGFGK